MSQIAVAPVSGVPSVPQQGELVAAVPIPPIARPRSCSVDSSSSEVSFVDATPAATGRMQKRKRRRVDLQCDRDLVKSISDNLRSSLFEATADRRIACITGRVKRKQAVQSRLSESICHDRGRTCPGKALVESACPSHPKASPAPVECAPSAATPVVEMKGSGSTQIEDTSDSDMDLGEQAHEAVGSGIR